VNSSAWIYGGIACLAILLLLAYRYGFLVPAPKGLSILLYHKVSSRHSDALTISVERLDRELAYIKSSGYTPISFSELKESLNGRRALPAKPVVVTFDDGYLSTYELAYPLLAKHGIRATVFLPTAFIGGVAGWDGANEPLMTWEIIRKLGETRFFEFGMHSHRHDSYEHYSAAQAETDLLQCLHALEDSGCAFTRVFAYPYGRMPKNPSADHAMREFFRLHDIDFAVRIGSRLNALPPKDIFGMKRAAVNGTDTFWEFKTKLRKGRIKLF
jgi:peptidoglycan/xylan/chitin deacetylase (PgdA/CDA1 family)